jgi:hypothetical protein
MVRKNILNFLMRPKLVNILLIFHWKQNFNNLIKLNEQIFNF